MKKYPDKRYSKSRKLYWKSMFDDYANEMKAYAVSGWSKQGMKMRLNTYAKTIKKLCLDKESIILDIGCGAGIYTRFLHKIGYKAFAIDYSEKVVSKALYMSDNSYRGKFLVAEAEAVPFKDNSFDHVVCIGLFQSLESTLSTIKEIYRIIKPNGTACVMTLNRKMFKSVFERLIRKEEIIFVNGIPKPRLKTYRPTELKNKFTRIGFENVTLQPVQVFPKRMEAFCLILPLWNKIPFLSYLTARSFMLIAQKSNFESIMTPTPFPKK
jgi:2-polyprenyl-3-methyl-5-hydroxy-6-metoxy-1,4-benzoquinol methylase